MFRAEAPIAAAVWSTSIGSGLVTGFTEKPPKPTGNLANAGMYAFNPSVLLDIDDTTPSDIGYELLPRLVGRARALPVEGLLP